MSDSLLDATLEKLLEADRTFLLKTELPIVTVSAGTKEDLKEAHGFTQDNTITDVVFSRAHYSMALALLLEAWGLTKSEVAKLNKQQPLTTLTEIIKPNKAWLVDPTNHVMTKDWSSVVMTERIGKLIARFPILKTAKDLIDRFVRSKLPILSSITPPLLYLTSGIKKPILSFHIAAGNILVDQGHTVVQVVTDPHVRPEYIARASTGRIFYAVFDTNTRFELLETAKLHGQKINPDHVVVTGPPVDNRIIQQRHQKHPWRNGPVKLCITTGGLGTNKNEIETILEQLLPELRRHEPRFSVLIYAGTQLDIAEMVTKLAHQARVKIAPVSDDKAPLRLLYHPQIVDANELLISHGFPWADGFITKPSGDMAYDAALSGSFLLTLQEWGEWEHNVRAVFEQRGIARQAEVEDIVSQLEVLTKASRASQSWVEQAMHASQLLGRDFTEGTKNILALYRQVD